MKHALMGLLLMVALPLFAQTMHFEGCVDRQGRPVPAVADDSLAQLARYGVEAGKPIIRFNTAAMLRLLPETRLFVVAGECGRQLLGFSATGDLTPAQAREADCWAVATLRRAGTLADARAAAAVEDDIGLVTSDGTQLSGPKRVLTLATCGLPVQSKGSLQLPAKGAANEKWDACVQRCGATLYSCGRTAACQQRYDQCSAACGSGSK